MLCYKLICTYIAFLERTILKSYFIHGFMNSKLTAIIVSNVSYVCQNLNVMLIINRRSII